MILVLFDFDGTITFKDSFLGFIRFSVGKIKYFKGFIYLIPILILYKLKFISGNKAKTIVFSYFFKGQDYNIFKSIADNYSLKEIDKIIRTSALNKINWHKKNNHLVVIVSASLNCYLEKWCKKNRLGLISTEIEIIDSKVTGKFKTRNCSGIEKINRIKEKYDLSKFEYIYAYGNTKDDADMLRLANKTFYRYFK